MNSDKIMERLKKLQQADEIMFQTAEKNMDTIINESQRVADVAHNSKIILDDLDERFRKETKLTQTDVSFLFVATGLQIARQYLLTEFPKRLDDKAAAKSSFLHRETHSDRYHEEYNPSLDQIWSNPVPFDAILGAAEFNHALGGGGRLGHRVTAIGHDPVLGLIFGTANIATATLTNYQFKSYHIGTHDIRHMDSFKKPASTVLVLEKTGEKLLFGGPEGMAKVGLSLILELFHLRSDLYSKHSLLLPGLSLTPKFASELASYGLDMANVVTVGKQAALAALINTLIAMIHRAFFDESRMDRKLYEVRTRKILMYSNVIASGSNLAVVAVTQNFYKLDLGGLAVAIYRLITDRKFIREVQHEFVFGSFNKMIQGDPLKLEDYSYEDILNGL